MKFDFVTLVGLMAAVCTTVSFLPQALRVIKTKSTKDISLEMYVLFTSGISFWIIYGILRKDAPIIIANLITLFLSVIILKMKLKYK